MIKIVIIDNYDSFTYNLSHLVKELGADVTVYRNDQFKLTELEVFDKIILSPGPGIPSEAGLLLDVIKTYAGKKPMLGVCLGHQAIAEAFGDSSKTYQKFITVWLPTAYKLPTTKSLLVCQTALPLVAIIVGWFQRMASLSVWR